MPEPLGKEVILRLYVDADYAGDGANRRSRTGFITYMALPCEMLRKSKCVLVLKVNQKLEGVLARSIFMEHSLNSPCKCWWIYWRIKKTLDLLVIISFTSCAGDQFKFCHYDVKKSEGERSEIVRH